MIIVIIGFNLLLTVINLYIAWRIWKLRLFLVKVTETLKNVERITYSVLHSTPPPILGFQQGTRNLKQSYTQLESQIRQLQKIIALLSLVTNLWRWSNLNLSKIKQ